MRTTPLTCQVLATQSCTPTIAPVVMAPPVLSGRVGAGGPSNVCVRKEKKIKVESHLDYNSVGMGASSSQRHIASFQRWTLPNNHNESQLEQFWMPNLILLDYRLDA